MSLRDASGGPARVGVTCAVGGRMGYSQSQLLLLTALLALAASSDAGLRKIPNWVTVATAVAGIACQGAVGGWHAAASGLLAGLAIFAVFFLLWSRRILGGGDLKLAVAAATWVGLRRAPQFLLAAAVAGGLIAAFCYLRAGMEARQAILANARRLHVPTWHAAARPAGAVLVPYGAAFAVGALFAIHF
jgi:prepilin peptidase CpaA